MLATPERIPGRGGGPDDLIWHKPVGRVVEDFQAIACSDEEGIVLPWSKRDVPLTLDEPGERWCPTCLTLARAH
jgi:uncharacterized protein (DUF2237 family)